MGCEGNMRQNDVFSHRAGQSNKSSVPSALFPFTAYDGLRAILRFFVFKITRPYQKQLSFEVCSWKYSEAWSWLFKTWLRWSSQARLLKDVRTSTERTVAGCFFIFHFFQHCCCFCCLIVLRGSTGWFCFYVFRGFFCTKSEDHDVVSQVSSVFYWTVSACDLFNLFLLLCLFYSTIPVL